MLEPWMTLNRSWANPLRDTDSGGAPAGGGTAAPPAGSGAPSDGGSTPSADGGNAFDSLVQLMNEPSAMPRSAEKPPADAADQIKRSGSVPQGDPAKSDIGTRPLQRPEPPAKPGTAPATGTATATPDPRDSAIAELRATVAQLQARSDTPGASGAHGTPPQGYALPNAVARQLDVRSPPVQDHDVPCGGW